MEELLIHNVRLDEDEIELLLLLLNLGFHQYSIELITEFSNDIDCLKYSIKEVQDLLEKFGFDFEINIERKEK